MVHHGWFTMNGFIFDHSLVLYLPFYQLDGASFMSRGKCGHLCTVTGALWRPEGRYFDGVDDKINCGTNPTIIALPEFSLGFHIRFKDLAADRGIWNWSSTQEIGVRATTAGAIYWYCNCSLGWSAFSTPAGAVQAGTWHSIWLTWKSTRVEIHVDGVSLHSTADPGTLNGWNKFEIGWERAASPDSFLKGDLGEVWLFNRYLTLPERQHIDWCSRWRY
jgi:hypothetical protein